MLGVAVGVPAGRVAAAKAVQQFLRLRQRQVAGADLDVQQHQVQVQKKVQINMRDVEQDGCRTRMRHGAQGLGIAAAKHPHRRACRGPGAARAVPLAVQKPLHIRQKADEFVVVAFVKATAAGAVFIDHLAPRRRLAHICQQLPGLGMPAFGAAHRHQPQRPEQHLPELFDADLRRLGGHGNGLAECRMRGRQCTGMPGLDSLAKD